MYGRRGGPIGVQFGARLFRCKTVKVQRDYLSSLTLQHCALVNQLRARLSDAVRSSRVARYSNLSREEEAGLGN
jgi:hypothetical protein